MPMSCSVCGNPLPVGARFCPNCGASVGPLLATEERKLVAVVFADLVDSTGLARRLDPERTREVLSRFFDAAAEELHALRGRPEKFIGDAVMAVFGLPQVREDDALRAIRAGLAIRGRARRLGQDLESGPLQVRIGVESGEAAMGVGPAGQLLITGTVVNAAARLQAAAYPGEVLAGPTAHALTSEKVLFGRKRRVRAKGFDGALDAYPVETITTRSVRRTIPFVGRVNEQGMLGESLGLASSSGKPMLVTIIGEPGIGKSRLADELAAGLSASVRVLRGQAGTYADTATFAPAAAIVADLAAIDDADPPELIRQKLRGLVVQCCDPAEVKKITDRLALLFGAAESRREESTFVQDVQSGFIDLVDGLARNHPVLLIFDDAHSLRPAMLDLIERVASPGRHGPRRALVLALARKDLLDARPSWGATGADTVVIRLEPLSLDESTRLVRQASGGKIAEPQAAAIAKRAGGNPFFIIETTGMLVGPGDGAPAQRRTLPPTVQAIVEARLDALPARLRGLARHASVFMHGFDLDELSLVDSAATEEELLQLEEAEVVVRTEGSPAGHWRIRHATLKEVAYENLPKRERVRLHRAVAQSLLADGHPAWAADHLELAAKAAVDLDPEDRTAPEEAADALLVAGDRARRRMESRSAVDRYQRALALAGAESGWDVREGRALAGMGEAHYWLGEYPEAKDALERAVAVARATDDPFALALALRFLGDIAINFEGDVDKAERLLQESLAASERLGDSWAIVRSLLFAGWVPWTRTQFDKADAIWRHALEVADPSDCWARIRALNALSINQANMDDLDGALRTVEEASRLAEECGDQFSIAMTAVQRARVFDDLGRHEDALPWFDKGIAIFSDVGARWEQADATAARGIAKRELGRLDGAENDLQFAIGVAEELGDRQLPGWTWRALARVSELRGDTATAEERRRRSEGAESVGPR